MATIDASHGYEAVAAEYTRRRDQSTVGLDTVRTWSGALTPGGTVLDLGCGAGTPIAAMLVAAGFAVYGVDASPSQVAAFRRRLPQAQVACEPAESSRFFDRAFDGVVAIGLVFLLDETAQRALLHKVGSVLHRGGRLLFSAPHQVCSWTDVLTGQTSRSLGLEAYVAACAEAGLRLIARPVDEGENHHFDFERR